ncbi:MAG: histidine phosphatase family protein [Lentisphaeria bacterium]|nr:histidine phosphatase family protein [Lentisphaeria bacterium]
MTETVIWILRHGETTANAAKIFQGQSEYPLDEIGIAQAEETEKRLKDEEFDVVFSSDLLRAKMTAEIAARGREIIYTPELREWHLGQWQGRPLSEVMTLFAGELTKFKEGCEDFTPPGGESTQTFHRRVVTFLQKTAQDYHGKKILLVTHGGVLTRILAHVMCVASFKARPHSDNCSLSTVSTRDGGSSWHLVRWNDSAHLTTSKNTLVF